MTILLRKVLDAIFNLATPAQAPTAATETIVSGSQLLLTGPLTVGTKFKWRVVMTKTGAGTGNTSFLVKSNTTTTLATGTSGGAATMATLAGPVAETAAAGSAYVDIEAVITAISATAGGICAKLSVVSSTAPATGFSNQAIAAVATTLDTSNDILTVGLAISTGAADVVTINYVDASLLAP